MNLQSFLRTTFRAGITMKGFDGVLETIGGVLLWFVSPSSMSRTLQMLFEHELSRDPHDFIAAHLLHASERLAQGRPLFASIFLLSHGIVKVVLAVALWLNHRWAYPMAIFVFSAFVVYQSNRYIHTHSIALLLLTIFDAVIVGLTWQEYGVQQSLRKPGSSVATLSTPG